MDLVRVLAQASRKSGAVVGVISSVDSVSGSCRVLVGSATVTAYLTDQTSGSAVVGSTAVMFSVGQTLVVVATQGGGTVLPPNLVPNGNFSQPGDGQIPNGWLITQDGSAALNWAARATAGPAGGFAGVVSVFSMGDNDSLTAISTPSFMVDGGETYTLSFSMKCDASVTNCRVWPSVQCFKAADTGFGQNVTNGVLSPNVSATYGAVYSTDLVLPSWADRCFVELGLWCDSSATGNVYMANVAFRRTA